MVNEIRRQKLYPVSELTFLPVIHELNKVLQINFEVFLRDNSSASKNSDLHVELREPFQIQTPCY